MLTVAAIHHMKTTFNFVIMSKLVSGIEGGSLFPANQGCSLVKRANSLTAGNRENRYLQKLKEKMIRPLITMFFLGLLATPIIAEAEDEHLLGDWAGLRTTLEERGITAGVVLTADFLYNTRGGIDEDGTILGNLDLTFEVDTEKAGWWGDGTFLLYALGNWNHGGFMTDIVGDLQATSNIEAVEALRLYEAWYEHQFADGRLSLLGGLHDFNSEFNALEYASLFTNSSFGISPDISQTGPSIFPTTSLAFRLRAQPTERSYLLVAVYDGVPGDPDNPRRTTIKLDKGDGVFAAGEVGLTEGEPGQKDYYKLGLGAWLHTADVENFDGQMHDRNDGVYLIGEKTLFAETDDGQGLGAFVQFGFADKDRNQLGNYWGAGLHYVGLIPGRDRDITGLAVASARNGDPFMKFSKEVEMSPVENTETVIELTYRAEIRPGLVLQPDVQYVIQPSMDPELDNALQIGVRLEMTF